jgi:CheY-like chemotaxis protein
MVQAPHHPRILVVDDHVELAENIAEILDGQGYYTEVAESAEQALACLPKQAFDALITDFRLPGLNGAELISAVHQRGNSLPCLVMSAFTDQDTVERARTAGAGVVLPKPVNIQALLVALHQILETGADAAVVSTIPVSV